MGYIDRLHPNNPEAKFDIDYYCNTHIPMVGGLLGDALKGGAVDYGLAAERLERMYHS
jgi:hypothetical protein